MCVTFTSMKELAQALEEVDIPRIETPGIDGPSIVVTDTQGLSTIQPAGQWVQVETDYPLWAELLAEWASKR